MLHFQRLSYLSLHLGDEILYLLSYVVIDMNDWLNKLAYLHLQPSIESEMRKLRFELKQTMEMYDAASKEAVVAKQKVRTDDYIFYIKWYS